jgi:exopolyphosphatase / guanosine-5'-triphosphate,3'-diphosphate pyrophosphatase
MELTDQNYAAIDIGTNSFHLIVVKIKEDGNFEIIDREKDVIRLGEGNANDIKHLTREAIDRALITLKRFKLLSDSYRAKIKAVATSAVREAHNKSEFIERVKNEVGIDVEIISGYEEARLIYLGVLKAVPVFNKKTLIVDIGGGSTEFLIGYKGTSSSSVSLKLGAVRLTQKFFKDGIISSSRIKECRRWVSLELYQVSQMIIKEGFKVCVGSSGTILAAASMIYAQNKKNSPSTILNNFEFDLQQLSDIEKLILSMVTNEKRKKIPGLDAGRVDIIPAGIIILKTIFDLTGINRMLVSGYALREGIIVDELQKRFAGQSKPNLSEIRRESILHLAKSCRYDLSHCIYVSTIAGQLFDQLSAVYNFNIEWKEYLKAASILHDIGYHISHTNHHHHSFYIIKNSELLGFNETEISIIAQVARYHRKSHPKKNHNDFEELSDNSKKIVKILASILRIADSFDRTHSQLIKSVGLNITSSKIEIELVYTKDKFPEIELWSLERRKSLLENVFMKKVTVKTIPANQFE